MNRNIYKIYQQKKRYIKRTLLNLFYQCILYKKIFQGLVISPAEINSTK